MFQKVFNDILSNLEYDNIPFEVVTENGKSVIRIDCGNKIGKIIFDDTEKREAGKMQRQDKENLIIIFQFMQHNDPNGDYWTYIEDIEAGEISLTETVTVLIRVLAQWKSDLHSRKNPLYAKMTTYQLVLAAMA